MPVNWNLGLMQSNPLAMVQAGFQQGQAMRQEHDQRNALLGYVKNPNDPSAAVNFAQAGDGRMAMQVMGDQRQQASQARLADVRTRAAQGDPAAKSELAGLDWEGWAKLDEGTRKQAKERVEVLGQAALIADTPQKWDAVIDQLAPQYPELARYKGKFSPEARNAVIAQAGEAKALMEQLEPKYVSVPAGGYLEDVNPRSRTGGAVPTGPASGVPQPGTVEGGYRFRGGDPANPSSWEPVGGPTQPASATFPEQ